MSSTSSVSSFSDLALDAEILQTLAKSRKVTPTPIQAQAIPVALTGKDIIGIAQTGTGKTFAFGLPLLHRLLSLPGKALVVVPTRELAFQVEESLKAYANALHILTVCLVGGAPMGGQKQMLAKKPRLIVATPGRLIDHLEQRTVSLQDVQILVLDEADRMFDMGFAPQIQRIVEHVGKERQTLLFSATMPAPIAKLAMKHMVNPTRIEIASAGTVADKIDQIAYMVKRPQKTALLATILSQSFGTALVFTRTKHGAKNLTRVIKQLGYSSAEIHSNRSLAQRRQALEGFKSGRYRVLVATDIAARGIDVAGIELVINYDLPENPEDYVHRIGRTARAGLTGKAISFAMPDQGFEVKRIERLTRVNIERAPLPELLEIPEMPQRDDHHERPARFERKREFGHREHGARSFRSGQHRQAEHKAEGMGDGEEVKGEKLDGGERKYNGYGRPRREGERSYGHRNSSFGGRAEGARSYGRPHREGSSSYGNTRNTGFSQQSGERAEGSNRYGRPHREGGSSYGRERSEGGNRYGRSHREGSSSYGSNNAAARPSRGGFGGNRGSNFGRPSRDGRPTGDRRNSRTPRRGASRPGNAPQTRFESKW